MAHIDRDSSHNIADNLVFLCLDHHDEYDSTSSQSKNITKGELKAFRSELNLALNEALSRRALFGYGVDKELEGSRMIEGHYIRVDDGDGTFQSAEIKVSTTINPTQFHVSGLALWGRQRPSGPNTGQMDCLMELCDGILRQIRSWGVPADYQVSIQPQESGLRVDEQNWSGAFGMNVYFFGQYRKVG